MQYNGLLDIADNFDLFIFDAYGVFWEGNGFYKSSREVMQHLVEQGKIVAVLSNTTQLRQAAIDSYIKRGLLPQRDYNMFITSGDLLYKNLHEESLEFQNLRNPLKYYVIGSPHIQAFAGTKYVEVKNIEEADFVYCGVPYIFAADKEKYRQFNEYFWPAKSDENGHITAWDSVIAQPFAEIVDKVIELRLPALNANPDFMAKEGHKLVPGAESVFVVRNGTVAEMIRQRGGEVLEYGKPHKNIYDFAFGEFSKQGIKINKQRSCMIGDTVRTDIKGAINAGIAPILCTATGVTAEEIFKGNTLESLCNNENIELKQIIQIKSVGGE